MTNKSPEVISVVPLPDTLYDPVVAAELNAECASSLAFLFISFCFRKQKWRGAAIAGVSCGLIKSGEESDYFSY